MALTIDDNYFQELITLELLHVDIRKKIFTMSISKDHAKQQYKNLNFDNLWYMGGLCIIVKYNYILKLIIGRHNEFCVNKVL